MHTISYKLQPYMPHGWNGILVLPISFMFILPHGMYVKQQGLGIITIVVSNLIFLQNFSPKNTVSTYNLHVNG